MKTVNLKLESFEGPYDLLFHLIEKNKIDIYDIPIAQLTEQYIEYIDTFSMDDMDSLSEFILMTATLIEIKSKLLLPKTISETEDNVDPRDELVSKLIEYKKYKSIVNVFHEYSILADKIYFKEEEEQLLDRLDIFENKEKIDTGEILGNITIQNLYDIFIKVLDRKDLKTDKVRSSFNSVTKDSFTIEEKQEHIKNLLFLYKEISFKNIFSKTSLKIEKVVTFLALLELIKINFVTIIQEKIFDEILIKKYNPPFGT